MIVQCIIQEQGAKFKSKVASRALCVDVVKWNKLHIYSFVKAIAVGTLLDC